MPQVSLVTRGFKRTRTRTYDAKNSPEAALSAVALLLCPTGTLVPSLSGVESDAWKRCDGQFLDPTEYPALFAVLGYTHGRNGDLFALPDLAGRSVFGHGGAAGLAPGALGGSASVTLTEAQMPVHTHDVSDPGHAHAFTGDPHTHAVTDPGHAHAAAEAGATAGGTDSAGAAEGLTAAATTGVTIDETTAGGTVGSATTGVTVYAAGGGQPVSIIPPAIGVWWMVRT